MAAAAFTYWRLAFDNPLVLISAPLPLKCTYLFIRSLFQIGGWVDKLGGEAGVDDAPENLEATQRALDAAQGSRDQVAQFLMVSGRGRF